MNFESKYNDEIPDVITEYEAFPAISILLKLNTPLLTRVAAAAGLYYLSKKTFGFLLKYAMRKGLVIISDDKNNIINTLTASDDMLPYMYIAEVIKNKHRNKKLKMITSITAFFSVSFGILGGLYLQKDRVKAADFTPIFAVGFLSFISNYR